MPKGKRLAALIDGSISTILAVVDGLGRLDVVRPIVGERYLVFVYLIGFAGALWLLDSDHRKQIVALSARRPSIRAAYEGAGAYPLHLTNRGQLEARRVQVQPISFYDYPWKGVFYLLGSLPADQIGESPLMGEFERQSSLSCCQTRPTDFSEFIVIAALHHAHSLNDQHRRATQEPPLEERNFVIRHELGQVVTISTDIRITYEDEFNRPAESVFTFDADLARTEIKAIRCDLKSEPALGLLR
jgi:hypothetical protein